jgi:transposase
MKQEKNTLKSIQQRRIFSLDVRKSTVKDIESGKCTVLEASRELGVSLTTIYRWLNNYSRYLKSNKILVVQEESELYKSKQLEQRLKELEAIVGRKQMEIDFLNKLIELAGDELGVDLKKNMSNPALRGSINTEAKNTDTK